MSQVQLFKSDHGKTITATAGDLATISLPENRGTGYRWATDGLDQSQLRPVDSSYDMTSGTGVGGGGTRNMTFELTKAGTARLELKLWREWEGDASVIERFAAIFEVK